MISWKETSRKISTMEVPPLMKIFSLKGEEKPNFLFWGHNIHVVLKGLKFSKKNLNIPKKYQIIILELPYWEDDKTKLYQRPAFEDPESYRSFYKEKYLTSSVFFTGSLEDYFENLNELIKNVWDLLSDQGFLVLKYTGRYRHYLKILIDNLLGYNKFVNENILQSPFYQTLKDENNENLLYDVASWLFIYSKSGKNVINPTFKDKESGGYWHGMDSKGQGSQKIFTINGVKHKIAPPVGTHWKFKQETIDEKCIEGKIRLNPTSGKPEYFVEKKKGFIVDNNWLDLHSFKWFSTGWRLSKKIYQRIIESLSKEQDVILHIFFGSDAAAKIAVNFNRSYVGLDPRILSINSCKKFFIENNISNNCYAIGPYQINIINEFYEGGFNRFILEALNAKIISQSNMFNGIDKQTLIHISPPNNTFTSDDLEKCFLEFEDFKFQFNSILIISNEFLEDDKWGNLLENSYLPKKKITFWKLSDFWSKIKKQGLFIESPSVELNIKQKNDELIISLEDFFFLNKEHCKSERDEKLKTKSVWDNCDHWVLMIYDDRNDLIFYSIYSRVTENEILPVSEVINLNEISPRLIKIKIFDVIGASYQYETKI